MCWTEHVALGGSSGLIAHSGVTHSDGRLETANWSLTEQSAMAWAADSENRLFVETER